MGLASSLNQMFRVMRNILSFCNVIFDFLNHRHHECSKFANISHEAGDDKQVKNEL